jgi:hypothetical protein
MSLNIIPDTSVIAANETNTLVSRLGKAKQIAVPNVSECAPQQIAVPNE